ncbi:protein kinase [Microbacterium maritypicum]|uniref:protein kinase domain-containing protein n=1 Tax=Microbacterium maritypicum TaxID=33918 RepID=UPI003D6DC270
MHGRDELLDPVEFVRPQTRTFIDTNVFMETREGFQGGLKALISRCSDAIASGGSPLIVPTKVRDELRRNQHKLVGTHPERAAKARNALAFVESASTSGLVRDDLGHATNPYADDLFLEVFERFAGTYSMCLLTFDITPKLRVRLLSDRTQQRLVAGHPTARGDIAVEGLELLLRKGQLKLQRLLTSDGDPREIASLRTLLPEFEDHFGLSQIARPAPRPRPIESIRPARPFDSAAALQPRDAPLSVVSLPSEGSEVRWTAGSMSGSYLLTTQLGEGGEGTVFDVDDHTVVKILNSGHITEHRKAKIELLVASGLNVAGICAPSAVVTNEQGMLVGYAMQKAAGKELQRTLFNRRKFTRDYPHWTKQDLVEICISFLQKVQYLHSKNILIGDINPKNIMVDENKHVSLIDADSWQLNGYPCPVGTPMFTSPRMLGKTYSDELRTLPDELYAVATMLFMIVMTGQFPYIRTGTEGDIVQLIEEGNFAFQYKDRNNKDQPNGDWKYMWSHLHKPVKDLFWHTFHKDGTRYARRPSVEEWLQAFADYASYLADTRQNYDPMSNELYPIRPKAYKPDTPIQDCSACGRSNAIAGIWNDAEREYFLPSQCLTCRAERSPRSSRTSKPAPGQPRQLAATCKDCHNIFPRNELRYGRCPGCTTRAQALDTHKLCVDCSQPFITNEHVAWFTQRSLTVPRSHMAIKKPCPITARPTKRPVSRATNRPAPPITTQPKTTFWIKIKNWFGSA